MILDFLVVLMTKHLSDQAGFYKDVLDLELIFNHQGAVGFGKKAR